MTSEKTDGVGHIENEPTTFKTPGEGELLDVDEQTARAAQADVGTAARQADDHPYDPGSDPDVDYTRREQEDSRLGKVQPSANGQHFDALRAAGKDSASLDSSLPAAAPRAGG